MAKSNLKTSKKVNLKNNKKCCAKINKEEVQEKLTKISKEVTKKVVCLKKKFDGADSATKNKIVTGVGVAVAGLVVLAGLRKHKNKK